MDEKDPDQDEKDFIERHQKDLNITFAAVRLSILHLHNLSNSVSYQAVLFSVVGAALAIGTRPELRPDPDAQTAALLRALLLALNQSAVLGETLAIQPVQEAPTSEVPDAIVYFYESSLVSLLAAIFAMLAKECLNGYFLQERGSAVDRRADRQRKFDALKNWRFDLLIRTPQILLRTALLFLALGVWQRLCYALPLAKYALAFVAMPGLVGYFGTVVNRI